MRFLLCLFPLFSCLAQTTWTVNSSSGGTPTQTGLNSGNLAYCLQNAGNTDTIHFILSSGTTISLTQPLPPVPPGVTITGANPVIINNASNMNYSTGTGAFVCPSGNATFTAPLTLSTQAQGITGNGAQTTTNNIGGGGGGGSMGVGGAFFIGNGANVTISNISLLNCQAIGGTGGAGGLGSSTGGTQSSAYPVSSSYCSAGEGCINSSGECTTGEPGQPGASGANCLIASNITIGTGGAGGSGGQPYDGMSNCFNPTACPAIPPGGAPGAAGGNAPNTTAANNASGIGAGGGGGGEGEAAYYDSTAACCQAHNTCFNAGIDYVQVPIGGDGSNGGTGVYGGGGGGGGAGGGYPSNTSGSTGDGGAGGTGGFGGGTGGPGATNLPTTTAPSSGGGGGGMGAGGAICVMGGTLTITDQTGPVTFSGSTVTGGMGGASYGGGYVGSQGTACGVDMFLSSISDTTGEPATSTLNLIIANSLTLNNVIQGDSGTGGGTTQINVSGGGTVILNGGGVPTLADAGPPIPQFPYPPGNWTITNATVVANETNVFSTPQNFFGWTPAPPDPCIAPVIYMAPTGSPPSILQVTANPQYTFSQIAGLADSTTVTVETAVTSELQVVSSGLTVWLGSPNQPPNPTYTFSGSLVGSQPGISKGTLAFYGSGTQILNGSGSINITVNGETCNFNSLGQITCPTAPATVEINGTITDPTVNAGGLLRGTGFADFVTVNAGGMIEGGNGATPGTLTLDGLVLTRNASLWILHTDGETSLVRVEGDALIDHAIPYLIIPCGTDLLGTLSAHDPVLTVNGHFSGAGFVSILSNQFFVTGDLLYSNGAFTLDTRLRSLENFVEGNNAKAVGRNLNQLSLEGNPAVRAILQDLSCVKDPGELQRLLNSLQPAQFKGVILSQENNILKVQDTINFRMEDQLNRFHCFPKGCRCAKGKAQKLSCENSNHRLHAWIDGLGDNLNQQKTQYAGSPQRGYTTNMGGVVAGIEDHFADIMYVGAIGAYTGSSTSWDHGFGKEKDNTGYAGLYLSALSDLFYGNLSVIGGWSHFSGHRDIIYPGQHFQARNSHGGSQILSHADTGFNLGWKGWTLRPFDAFDYISQTENGFTEKGAGSRDLHVHKSTAILLRNELGLQLAGCICKGATTWSLSPKLSWVREVRVRGSHYTAEFVGSDVPFTVTGYFPDRSLISPGFLLSGKLLNDLLSLDLYYNGEYGHKYSDTSYGGQIRFGF